MEASDVDVRMEDIKVETSATSILTRQPAAMRNRSIVDLLPSRLARVLRLLVLIKRWL